MALSEELRAGLQNLLASGSFEIRESCSRVTPLPPVSWERRGAPENCSRRSGGELQARLTSNHAPVETYAHFSVFSAWIRLAFLTNRSRI
jgi:hypothetical protein